jgi:hypothetical protein
MLIASHPARQHLDVFDVHVVVVLYLGGATGQLPDAARRLADDEEVC